jgi:hypothetical protein
MMLPNAAPIGPPNMNPIPAPILLPKVFAALAAAQVPKAFR